MLEPSDAERTMREERWILSSELHDSRREEPDEVKAFRVLYESEWVQFVTDTEDNDALKFFNTEQSEFSSVADWNELAESEGIKPFDRRFAIHPAMEDAPRDLCRQIRMYLREESLCDDGDIPEAMFWAPREFPGEPTGDFVMMLTAGRALRSTLLPIIQAACTNFNLNSSELGESVFQFQYRELLNS